MEQSVPISLSHVIKGHVDKFDTFLKFINFLSLSRLMSVMSVSKTGEISLKKYFSENKAKTVRVKNYNVISESLSPEH